MGEGQPPYTEFLLDGHSIAGAWEMNPMVPARGPELLAGLLHGGGRRRGLPEGDRPGREGAAAAQEFPGGRFAIVSDPEGASFGLLKMAPR